MKALFILVSLLGLMNAHAGVALSRLDCQASNGVSLSTIRPHFNELSPVIVEAKWLGLSSVYLEASLENSDGSDSSIILTNEKDSYVITLPINEGKFSAQNLTGSLWTSSKIFLGLIYCTIELENL